MSPWPDPPASEFFDANVLCAEIQYMAKRSGYAVGGSIPITSLGSHAICGSDVEETESEKDTPMKDPDVQNHDMRCEPITIRWDSLTNEGVLVGTKVTLPLNEVERSSFEQLLRDCQPVTFGQGNADVTDEEYGKEGKLDENAFCSNFNPYALGIVNTAAQKLAPYYWKRTNEESGVRAELYKLNVYSAPSGKFKPHVDTSRSRRHFGSLVVCLPSIHEGGQLVVRHKGREIIFDWSGDKGAGVVQWAAFYSGCEHEVLEVTAGHRVTLTYNLYYTCAANRAMIDPGRLQLTMLLENAISQRPICHQGIIFGYYCMFSYPHNDSETIRAFPSILRGVDQMVYESFRATGKAVRLVADVTPRRYGKTWSKWKETSSFRLDNPDQDGMPALLTDGLPKLGSSGYVFNNKDGEAYEEIFRRAGIKLHRKSVTWLNSETREQRAIVHAAYRKQAKLVWKYSTLAIIVEIPPTKEGQACFEESALSKDLG